MVVGCPRALGGTVYYVFWMFTLSFPGRPMTGRCESSVSRSVISWLVFKAYISLPNVFGWPLPTSGSGSPDAKAARNQCARGSVPTKYIVSACSATVQPAQEAAR